MQSRLRFFKNESERAKRRRGGGVGCGWWGSASSERRAATEDVRGSVAVVEGESGVGLGRTLFFFLCNASRLMFLLMALEQSLQTWEVLVLDDP